MMVLCHFLKIIHIVLHWSTLPKLTTSLDQPLSTEIQGKTIIFENCVEGSYDRATRYHDKIVVVHKLSKAAISDFEYIISVFYLDVLSFYLILFSMLS